MSSLNAQREGTVRSIFVRVQSVLVAKALTSYAGKGYYWHDLYSVPAIHTDLLTPKMMPGATDKLSPETMSILLILASSRYHLISHAGSLSPTAREGGQALSVRTSWDRAGHIRTLDPMKRLRGPTHRGSCGLFPLLIIKGHLRVPLWQLYLRNRGAACPQPFTGGPLAHTAALHLPMIALPGSGWPLPTPWWPLLSFFPGPADLI